MYKITSQDKESLNECFNFLNNIQINGYNNILNMANALVRLQYILESLQNEKEDLPDEAIEIDNSKNN